MSGINDYDPVLLRVLAHLQQRHASSSASVAIFGESVDTEITIRSVYQLGFDFHYSNSDKSFIENVRGLSSTIFILIIGAEISSSIAADLSEFCGRANPLYIARTYSREGINPEIGKYYKSIFHRFDPVSQAPAAIRVSQATFELYHRANEESLAERPLSKAMREELGLES